MTLLAVGVWVFINALPTPTGIVRMGWIERHERTSPLSTPLLSAQMGIEDALQPWVSYGLKIATQSDTPLGSRFMLPLSLKKASHALGFSQAYVRFDIESSLRSTSLLGKFSSPSLVSPLIWDHELYPEGVFESLQWKFENADSSRSFTIEVFSAAISLHQNLESMLEQSSEEHSWLFEQGLRALSKWGSDVDVHLEAKAYIFHRLRSTLAQEALALGNSVRSESEHYTFEEDFFPLEILLHARAYPLGIQTSVTGAVAMNFQTDDKQRGFYVEGSMGNPWRQNNFMFSLSYSYLEPDLTPALFTPLVLGGTNRKGPRAEVLYFILDRLKIGVSFAYLDTLQKSAYQAARKEGFLDMELRF